MTIKVKDLELDLKRGTHKSPDEGACIMEAMSYVAGEPWSDHPACVSRIITAFLRSWNDSLPTDEDRNRLLGPLIPRLVGTAASKEIEVERAWMAVDWSIRVSLPAWMALTPALEKHAKKFKALLEIKDKASWQKAEPILAAARIAARAAAEAAARAVARDAASAAGAAAEAAAWIAAGAAAEVAARDAASAAEVAAGDAASAAEVAAGDALSAVGATARDAARVVVRETARAIARDAASAAGIAAGAAAWATARDAARKKLAPTVRKLQESALELVDRMIDCGKSANDRKRE